MLINMGIGHASQQENLIRSYKILQDLARSYKKMKPFYKIFLLDGLGIFDHLQFPIIFTRVGLRLYMYQHCMLQ